MELLEAISARHSVRAYKETPLSKETVAILKEKIDVFNRVGNLHIQLVMNEPKAFQGTMAKYGKFRGVTNYIVMAGKKSDDLDERVGYYGEHLVLLAQTLGTYVLADGEKIACYIAIGYGETQGRPHKIKKPEQVSNACDLTPRWFRKGVEAALLAPTAVNQQKFHFEYVGALGGGKHKVVASRKFSIIGYTQLDLGIAKCHFEIGAGKDLFEWA